MPDEWNNEGRPSSFAEIIELAEHGPDTWVGESPRYNWGRVYGGQVVSQALRAALHTVDAEYLPHSLHAYFIRGGNVNEPIRYEVDRLRDGRSFCTRAVVARQSSGAILHLSCSFQVEEAEFEIQVPRMPLAPSPDDMKAQADNWPTIMERRSMVSHPGAGKSMSWVRLTDPLSEDPFDHACGLAFTSDTIQFGAARSLHPLSHSTPKDKHHDLFMGASLDHAMWFHRPAQADEWHLYQWDCHGLRGGRGITIGNLFDQEGNHVASIAQELLLRERKER